MNGEIRNAFEMRLHQMKPIDHTNKALDMIGDSTLKQDVIIKWRKVIKELVEQEQTLIDEQDNPQNLYPLMAGFPTGFFAYFFKIDAAMGYFKEQEIKPIKLQIKHLIKYVDQTQFDPTTRSEIYNKDMPIIVIDSPLFNQPFCISGSLKIGEAYRFKKSNMKIYYLMTDDYLPLMFDKLSKAMHMFHLDLTKMTSSHTFPKEEELYIFSVNEWLAK